MVSSCDAHYKVAAGYEMLEIKYMAADGALAW